MEDPIIRLIDSPFYIQTSVNFFLWFFSRALQRSFTEERLITKKVIMFNRYLDILLRQDGVDSDEKTTANAFYITAWQQLQVGYEVGESRFKAHPMPLRHTQQQSPLLHGEPFDQPPRSPFNTAIISQD